MRGFGIVATRARGLRSWVSPFLLTRYYMTKDVRSAVARYGFAGEVLDYGCGTKPYKYLFTAARYIGIDFAEHSRNRDAASDPPDLLFPADFTQHWQLPFDDAVFSHAVSFQVLEHHPQPELMLRELRRVTRTGGFLLLSAPFLGGLHEEPHDYQRLTEYALQERLTTAGWTVEALTRQGSLPSTLALLVNEHTNFLAGRSKRRLLLVALLIHPFALLASYSALALDRVIKSRRIFHNYLVVARAT